MANETTQSPIRAMFEVQQSLVKQGQHFLKQSLDVQKNMMETVMRNNLGTGQTVQRQNTDMARNWMDAYFGTFGSWFAEDEAHEMRQSIDDQFEEFDEVQREAWESFQDSLEDSMQAYEELNDSQKELIDRSVDSFFEAQYRAGEEVSEVAEEMEQLAREGEHASRQEASGS